MMSDMYCPIEDPIEAEAFALSGRWLASDTPAGTMSRTNCLLTFQAIAFSQKLVDLMSSER